MIANARKNEPNNNSSTLRRKNDAPSLQHGLNRRQIECAGGIEEPQNSDKHENRAEHRVQHKFQSGVNSALVAPDADQKIHGDQHHFPENEEQKQVERNKNADHARLEDEQRNKKSLYAAAMDRIPRCADRDRREKCGEQNEKQADAIDAEVIVNRRLRDPVVQFFELVARGAGIESANQPERNRKLGKRNSEREALKPNVIFAAQQQQSERARGGQKHEQSEQMGGVHHLSHRQPEQQGSKRHGADHHPSGVAARVAGFHVARRVASFGGESSDAVYRAVDHRFVDRVPQTFDPTPRRSDARSRHCKFRQRNIFRRAICMERRKFRRFSCAAPGFLMHSHHATKNPQRREDERDDRELLLGAVHVHRWRIRLHSGILRLKYRREIFLEVILAAPQRGRSLPSADDAEHRENYERYQHYFGRFVNVNFVLVIFRLAEECEEDQPEHVERGEQHGERAQGPKNSAAVRTEVCGAKIASLLKNPEKPGMPAMARVAISIVQ